MAALLLGAGLALHAAGLWRAHVLLAGDRPALAAGLGAVALLAALVGLGRVERGGLLGLAGGGLVAVSAVAAPLFFARLPSSATPFVALVLAALPAGALVALPRRPLAPALAGGGAGALAAALLLPFASPGGATLSGALLVALGGLVLRPRPEEPLEPARRLDVVFVAAGALVLAVAAFTLVGGGAHPWPARPAQAAFLLLGAALGLALGRRAPGGPAALVVAGAGVAVGAASLLGAGLVDRVVASLASDPSRPAIGVAGGLLTLLSGAALLGLPAGLGAGLAAAPASRRLSAIVAAALVFAVAGCGLAVVQGRELDEIAAPAPSSARHALRDGHAVAWAAADRLPDDLFAAHVGSLLATGRGRAVVLGWGSPETLAALRLHGFSIVEEAGPARATAAALDAAGRSAPSRLVRGRADVEALGPCDVIVSNLEDPTLPAHEAFFTQAAQDAIRRSLLPGGVFVQRLSLDRLGPEGLTRHLLLLHETFPSTWLVTSDLGRGGSALAVCFGPPAARAETAAPEPVAPATAPPLAAAAPAGGAPEGVELSDAPDLRAPRPGTPVATAPIAPAAADREREPALPVAFLRAIAELPPDVAASLRRARLLNASQVLATFAVSPAMIPGLAGGLEAHDAWLPGSLAFRHPAPPEPARNLAQALLYGRIAYADIPFEPAPRAGGGSHPQAWDVVGIDSRLGPEWRAESASVRWANHIASVLDHPAVSREEARRVVLVAPDRRLEIRQRRAAEGTREVVAAALADLEGPGLVRSGGAVVHGHPALWMLEQDGTARQEITLAWWCPVRASLYGAELVLTGPAVKPGLYEAPLSVLTDDLRCRHPQRPEAPAPAAEPSAQAGEASEAPRP